MHDYEKFKCAFCDHVAASAQNKATHEKRIHLGMDCKTCRRLFDSEAEKAQHACAEPERFRCDQCAKSYKAKGELRNHVMVVHEGRRIPCPDCADVLSSVQALKRHQKSFHFGAPKDHVCEICAQAFTHRDTWKKHVLTHDKVMRSDPCPYCGKVLRNKDVMRQHINALHEKNFRQVESD
jgi:KRAB domain-containing zinc finger protein